MSLYQIDASRAIAAKASSRGTVKELIGVNFDIDLGHEALRDKLLRIN